MIKQSIILGTLAIFLTGCVVSPFNDYSNRDHGRFEQRQQDSNRGDRHRYDRDQDRNIPSQSNQDRPNKPNWNQDQHRNDSNRNRPR